MDFFLSWLPGCVFSFHKHLLSRSLMRDASLSSGRSHHYYLEVGLEWWVIVLPSCDAGDSDVPEVIQRIFPRSLH